MKKIGLRLKKKLTGKNGRTLSENRNLKNAKIVYFNLSFHDFVPILWPFLNGFFPKKSKSH